jgi:hypothetical protein
VYLRAQGHPEQQIYTFDSVVIDHVSLVDGVLFSTVVDGVFDETRQSVTFHFDAEAFGELLVLASTAARAQIHARLRQINRFPRTIELSSPITCQIDATLGEPQMGRADGCIPLVIRRMVAAGRGAD